MKKQKQTTVKQVSSQFTNRQEGKEAAADIYSKLFLDTDSRLQTAEQMSFPKIQSHFQRMNKNFILSQYVTHACNCHLEKVEAGRSGNLCCTVILRPCLKLKKEKGVREGGGDCQLDLFVCFLRQRLAIQLSPVLNSYGIIGMCLHT